jgi:hypothetical protein
MIKNISDNLKVSYFGNKVENLDPKLTILNIQVTGRLFSNNNNVSLAFAMRSPVIDPVLYIYLSHIYSFIPWILLIT